MKKFAILDNKKRIKFLKIEWKFLIFRYLFNNLNIKKDIRLIIFDNFINRILFIKFYLNNRCVFQFNIRSVNNFFKISAMCFKNFYSKNIIPGIRKSSW